MSRFLEAIGIHAMTNREALMEELDALDDEAFLRVMFGEQYSRKNGINLFMLLDGMVCEKCKAAHGGKCSYDENNPDSCTFDIKAWISQPYTHERLLPEVTA